MRHDGHSRTPDDVEDGQVVGPMERRNASPRWLAERRQHGTRVGHGTRHDLPCCPVARVFAHGGPTILDKMVEIKHGFSPPVQLCLSTREGPGPHFLAPLPEGCIPAFAGMTA
jgi:hypothetical protein